MMNYIGQLIRYFMSPAIRSKMAYKRNKPVSVGTGMYPG